MWDAISGWGGWDEVGGGGDGVAVAGGDITDTGEGEIADDAEVFEGAAIGLVGAGILLRYVPRYAPHVPRRLR